MYVRSATARRDFSLDSCPGSSKIDGGKVQQVTESRSWKRGERPENTPSKRSSERKVVLHKPSAKEPADNISGKKADDKGKRPLQTPSRSANKSGEKKRLRSAHAVDPLVPREKKDERAVKPSRRESQATQERGRNKGKERITLNTKADWSTEAIERCLAPHIIEVIEAVKSKMDAFKGANPEYFTRLAVQGDTVYGTYSAMRTYFTRGSHPEVPDTCSLKLLTSPSSMDPIAEKKSVDIWQEKTKKQVDRYTKFIGDVYQESIEQDPVQRQAYLLVLYAAIEALKANEKLTDELLTLHCTIDPNKVKRINDLLNPEFSDRLINVGLIWRVVFNQRNKIYSSLNAAEAQRGYENTGECLYNFRKNPEKMRSLVLRVQERQTPDTDRVVANTASLKGNLDKVRNIIINPINKVIFGTENAIKELEKEIATIDFSQTSRETQEAFATRDLSQFVIFIYTPEQWSELLDQLKDKEN